MTHCDRCLIHMSYAGGTKYGNCSGTTLNTDTITLQE